MPGTTYYIRAYATSWNGTVYGNEQSFVTLQIPEIKTNIISDVTETSAIASGNITRLGIPDASSYGVCWSTSNNPTTSDNISNEGIATSIGSFSSNITGLLTGTKYYVRAYATNSVGTVYGQEISFVTQQLPAVAAIEITDITDNSATFKGNVTAPGIPVATDYGVCWSKTTNPTILNYVTDEGEVRNIGEYKSSLINLDHNTLYYVRAFANNVLGTVYSEQITFQTLKGVGVSDYAFNKIKIYGFNNELIVRSDESIIAEIAVYNLSGEKILSENMNGEVHRIEFLDKGLYIVKLTSSKRFITQKVIF